MGNKIIFDNKIPVQFLSDEEYESLGSEKQLPAKKTERAAGFDVVSVSDPEIVGIRNLTTDCWRSIDYIQYRTGIKIGPEKTHFLAFPRSSVSKYNLTLANSVGLIDCCVENSKVLTNMGEKNIQDLKINDIVFSYNEEQNIIEKDIVSCIKDTGYREIIEIETGDGTIQVTPNTIVYTVDGVKPADELTEMDVLLFFKQFPLYINENK